MTWGPIRGSLYGGADYFESANNETQLYVMLETETAVGNAEAILAAAKATGTAPGIVVMPPLSQARSRA